MTTLLLAVVLGGSGGFQPTPDPVWTVPTKEDLKVLTRKGLPWQAKEKSYFKCNLERFREVILRSPVWHSPGYLDKMTIAVLPWYDGKLVRFRVCRRAEVTDWGEHIGVSFDGVSVEGKLEVKGFVSATLVSADVTGPPLKDGVRITIAAPSQHHLYVSYLIDSVK